MPNWAYNNNLFYSKNKDVIYDLHDKLNTWTTIPSKLLNPAYWDGSAKWLGNLLLQAGLTESKVIDDYYGKCRGELVNLSDISANTVDDIKYFYFSIDTTTAWCQMSKMWISLLQHLYGAEANNIGYSWLSEEDNCDIYERHDPHKMLRLLGYSGNEDFRIDSYISSDSKYNGLIPSSPKMLTEIEAFKITSDILGQEINKDNLEDALNKINKLLDSENNDSYLHINKIEDVELLID